MAYLTINSQRVKEISQTYAKLLNKIISSQKPNIDVYTFHTFHALPFKLCSGRATFHLLRKHFCNPSKSKKFKDCGDKFSN